MECVDRVAKGHDQVSNACVALPDGRFASVGRDRTLRFWAAGDRESRVVSSPHRRSVKCVAASPDGRWIATGAYDGRVWVYDARDGRWASEHRPTTSGISCLAPAGAPGEFLASSYDGSIYTLRGE